MSYYHVGLTLCTVLGCHAVDTSHLPGFPSPEDCERIAHLLAGSYQGVPRLHSYRIRCDADRPFLELITVLPCVTKPSLLADTEGLCFWREKEANAAVPEPPRRHHRKHRRR